MTVFHTNIQGIRTKLDEFECFLLAQAVAFDFVCLTEHWLNYDELCGGLSLAGWNVVSFFARVNHIRGGVMLCAREGLSCVSLECINCLSSEVHCEIVSLLCKSSNIVIVCFYRSPSGDFEMFF